MNRRQFFAGVAAAGTAAVVPDLSGADVSVSGRLLAQLGMGRQELVDPAMDVYSVPYSEIFSATMRQYAPEIARNISANNALFERLTRKSDGEPS